MPRMESAPGAPRTPVSRPWHGRLTQLILAASCVVTALGMAIAYLAGPDRVPAAAMRLHLIIVVVATIAVLVSTVVQIKRSHEEVAASGRVLRAMMAAFPFPLFALGPDRSVRACNEAAMETFRCGYRTCGPQCTEAMSLCGFVRETPSQEDRECIDGRPITWTRPDGRHFEFELYARPLTANQRGDLGHLAMLQDVTDRRRAEMGMRTAAEEWTQTFDALNALVVIVDEQQRIHRINLAARRLLGKSYQEIVHRPLHSLAAIEPFRTIQELLNRGRELPDGFVSDFCDKETGKTWAISVSNVCKHNGASYNIFLVRDVTELVHLRDSLRASEALSTLGSLVGGVAHQVRNPLFTISATLDTLDAVGAPTEEHQLFLSVLRQQVQRLDAVMKDLLRFGRPQDLVLKDGSVTTLLHDVIQACELEAAKRTVTIKMLAPPDSSAHLPMDRPKLFGALQNVVENAVQHSPTNGTVSVQLDLANGKVVCRVIDGGQGFADVHRVFEPFYTRRPGGTGLGLPIAKGVIEQHGGSIQARNGDGGGGEVIITLPISTMEAEHAASLADRG